MLQNSLRMLKYMAVPGVVLTCILGFQNNAVAGGNFANSCRNIRMYNGTTILHAICKSKNGTEINTSMGLNSIIGNLNGKLTWNKSNFYATCKNLYLNEKGLLVGVCKMHYGNYVTTSLNLNEKIANDSGRLTYRP